jgi:endonuclease/exonuclease/phosphatase family metal-dependent hydrolase
MGKSKFTKSEWASINRLFSTSSGDFGLPQRRDKSVVLGTFNIRELGKVKNRSTQAWDFIAETCERFDLLAVQEVADNLEGIAHIKGKLGQDFGLVMSDVTGVFPGDRGNPERLAFLFNWRRIGRSELASDITYDRSKIINTLFKKRATLQEAWELHLQKLGAWEEKKKIAKATGKKKPGKPAVALPIFLTFIRQPHCASFRVMGRSGVDPIDLLVVNAHLLYGINKKERLWEFEALIDWLTLRAKQRQRMYHQNILMMGDCNLEFEDLDIKRQEIDARLKKLNETKLKSKKAAKVNFPLLTKHPTRGELKTSARKEETYDQIAIFAHDERLPTYEANKNAGKSGDDGYDYGVFDFANLFAEALYDRAFNQLTSPKQDYIFQRAKQEISDHMPVWIRLPVPGA